MKNVFFDVDSTLVTIEGLDFLAELKGKEQELKMLTLRAMNGELSMREAMQKKMDSLRPSMADLQEMGRAYIQHLVPGAKETIEKLQTSGHATWILTGNFQPAVGILARFLRIPETQIISNEITFTADGEYVAFNPDHPLSNNHGKAKVIELLKDKINNIIMVGDGSTDLDTQPVVDLFIGFGGVVKRPAIAQQASLYIEDQDLQAILPYIL